MTTKKLTREEIGRLTGRELDAEVEARVFGYLPACPEFFHCDGNAMLDLMAYLASMNDTDDAGHPEPMHICLAIRRTGAVVVVGEEATGAVVCANGRLAETVCTAVARVALLAAMGL